MCLGENLISMIFSPEFMHSHSKYFDTIDHDIVMDQFHGYAWNGIMKYVGYF